MDDVQKRNICINVPSSQNFRSYGTLLFENIHATDQVFNWQLFFKLNVYIICELKKFDSTMELLEDNYSKKRNLLLFIYSLLNSNITVIVTYIVFKLFYKSACPRN
jgi:hypothetical protein